MPIVSKDAFERSLAKRVSLNRQILKSPYWMLPVDDSGHEEFMPVGRGERTSVLCGSHRSFSVCYNIEGHKGKFLDGVDCTDKVVVRHNHMWCNKSSCSVCFIRGWSVNRARKIEGRLVKGVELGFGQVEHFVVSVAVADRGLSEAVMRKKCRDALKDRGVTGSCLIFHGFRVDRERDVLKWSPHYHGLGFIEGGYSRCRKCEKLNTLFCSMSDCDGFEAKTRECFKKDGYIVKVMAERGKSFYDDKPNIFGTAFYHLNHATVRVGIKRFHCITWFGCVAKRKFKSAEVKVEILCPICRDEMVKSMHMGKRHIVKDIGHTDYVPVFADERLDENGELNWVPLVGSRFG